jgi:hypothetical protein
MTVRPAGSAAETVKLTWFPIAEFASPGMVKTGALACATETASFTAVAPNWTAKLELCCVARGLAYARNVSAVCPGRVIMTAGSCRSVSTLETVRRATTGMLGEFN